MSDFAFESFNCAPNFMKFHQILFEFHQTSTNFVQISTKCLSQGNQKRVGVPTSMDESEFINFLKWTFQTDSENGLLPVVETKLKNDSIEFQSQTF